MDSFIWRGYNASKESADELPQLSDYDFASHLKNRGFKVGSARLALYSALDWPGSQFLDTFSGASPRHLIFGITSIFRKDIASIIFLVILSVLASFISPIGIYQLLKQVIPNIESVLKSLMCILQTYWISINRCYPSSVGIHSATVHRTSYVLCVDAEIHVFDCKLNDLFSG